MPWARPGRPWKASCSRRGDASWARDRGRGEQGARGLEPRRRMARGHQSIVANLHEALGQYVREEASEERFGRERTCLALLGAEGDAALVHRHKTMVGDP